MKTSIKVKKKKPKYEHMWGQTPIVPSPKFPNESFQAQIARAAYKIPNDVDIDKDVLFSTEQGKRWNGHKVRHLKGLWKGCTVTKVDDKEEVVAIVRKVLDGRFVVRAWRGPLPRVINVKDDGWEKEVWKDTTEVVWGAFGHKTLDEVQAIESSTRLQFSGVDRKVNTDEKEVSYTVRMKRKGKVERDEWGAKIGSGSAAINAVITDEWKTAKRIEREAKTDRNVSSHLASLVKKGRVKKKVSSKSGEVIYKRNPA